MASWTRLDSDIYTDSDFHSLWLENTAFPWMFTALVAIAKKAADVDPETWQGHLVSPSGRALSQHELTKILPRLPRAHDKTCDQFFAALRRLRLITEICLQDCDAISAGPEQNPDMFDTRHLKNSTQFVMQVSDWFRWYQMPERPKNTSTKRVQAYRARNKKQGVSSVSETRETPSTDKTNKTYSTDPPNPPRGEVDFLDAETIDPDELPPDPRGSEPASDDPTKFSSMLTRDQAAALRGAALREVVHKLSPGGLAQTQKVKLFGYLNTKPPAHWREEPGRWADHLFHFVTLAVTEIQDKLASSRKHGIDFPAAAAISRAQAMLAEFTAELGAA